MEGARTGHWEMFDLRIVAALSPIQALEVISEHTDANLAIRIVLVVDHDHAEVAHALTVLGPR